MEKLNLTARVCELKHGQIFWFSGNWRCVQRIDDKYLYYNTWYESTGKSNGNPETLMKGSLMKVEVKGVPKDGVFGFDKEDK